MRRRPELCAYCGREGDMTTDHVVPLAAAPRLKVRRRMLDVPSNRVRCCFDCNQEKGCKMPAEWFALHPEYRNRVKSHLRYASDLVRELCGV